MAIILEAVAANGAVQRLPLAEGTTAVPAQPGLRYRLINDAGGRVAPAALVRRIEGDLVVEGLPEEKSLSLQGFFTRCTPQNACSLSMENIGGEPDEAVTPATQPVAALPDGGLLMYASGMAASAAAPPRESEYSFKPLVGVVGGLAIAGAAGGGGGGGSRSSDTTPPAAPLITSGAYTNNPKPVFAGTAEPGSTLTMTLDVGSNGTSDVTYSTRVASDGSWRIDTASATPTAGSLPTIAHGVTTSIAARATDAAGNPSPLTTGTVTLDTIAPGTPTIDSPLLTNDPTPLIEGSAEPGAIVTVSLDLDRNGTTDVSFTTTTGSSGTYAIDLGTATPTSGTLPGGKLGDLSTTDISVVASDLAGNASPAATAVLRVDTSIPPPPTIDTIAGDDAINAAEALQPVTITGTLDPAHADRPVSVQWGTLAPRAATVTGTDWTITFAAADIPDDGVRTVRVTYVGAAGTTSAEATQGVLIDRVAPTPPTITDNVDGTATGPVTFTFTFAEPVRGFTAADVAVTGGSKGAFTGIDGDTVYTLVVTPTAGVNSGTVSVSVPAGTFIDLAGNANSAAAPAYTQPYDTLAPTIAISDNVSGTASGPVTFTFTFSEPVTGFTGDDVAVTNGTKGAFNAVSGTVYTLVVTPATGTTGNMTVSVAAGAASDAAGNASGAQSASQPIDTVPPTLVITDNVAGTANGPVTFTFTFSEPVNGFTTGDITVTGGTKGALTGSGAVYQMVVTPAADDAGTIEVSVAAGAASDAAGNPSGAGTASQPFDTNVPPTLVITDNVAGTASGPVTFTFTFSEPVNGFAADDITVTGGTKGAFTGSNGDTVYTLVVNPTPDTSGTINLSVPAAAAADLAGNPSVGPVAATQAFNTAVAPTLVITDNVAGTANGPVTFTFTFSEPVNGFTTGDVTVTGGTKGTFTGSNGDTVYTLVVNPTPNANGTINLSVPANAAEDLAGNPSVGPVAASQTFDTAAPTVTITDNVAGIANGPVTFTFTFSEPVNGFTTGDVTVTGGTKGAFTGSNGDTVYTLVVNPTPDTSGTINLSVPAAAAADLAGNPSVGPVAASQTFDTAAPTVTITDVLDDVPPDIGSVANGGTTDDNSPTLVLNFSEVFGTGASVQVFRNGASIGFATQSNSTTANFTDPSAPADGTYTYTATMTDAAGNVGSSSPYTVIIDTTP